MGSETAAGGPAPLAGAALHAAIEAQFLRAVGRGATIVETAAFRVHLWPTPDPFYRNVAVPIRRPDDWPAAIAAMQAAFRSASRPARLEFIEERWPDLPDALATAGLVEVARQRLMVTTRRSPPPPAGPTVRPLPAVRATVERYLAAVCEAFRQPMDARTLAAEADKLAAEIGTGRCRVAVVEGADGRALAGASLIGIDPEPAEYGLRVGELAGVWTTPSAAGQGLASRVVTRLVDGAVAPGDTLVWLAAEGARTIALYARLGFRPVGWQRNYSAAAA